MRKLLLLVGYLLIMVGMVAAQVGECERIVAEAFNAVDECSTETKLLKTKLDAL